MSDVLLKGIREKCLRTLAQSGKTAALNRMHGLLYQYDLARHIRRAEREAEAGNLETAEEIRLFIGTIT